MLTSVRIRNFRVFRDLRLDRLGPVNLITGKNNAGKTTLLEALFLLAGGGHPLLATRLNEFREMRIGSDWAEVFHATWRYFFRSMAPEHPVRIDAAHGAEGKLTLTIARHGEEPITLGPPRGPSDNGPDRSTVFTTEGSPRPISVRFRRTRGGAAIQETGFLVHPDSLTGPAEQHAIRGVLVAGRSGGPREDARRLGRLRMKKQGEQLLGALQLVEPRLVGIEVNSGHGEPMIWGDIGLPELVPLPVMGSGMTRITRILLAILDAPGGVVLVDKVEDGIHHDAFKRVLGTIAETAKALDVQLFLTTHSYECVRKANAVLGENYRLYRLEEGDRVVAYEPRVTRAALRNGLEVR